MKPKRFKPKNAGCPQWIIEGIREKYQQATAPKPTTGDKTP